MAQEIEFFRNSRREAELGDFHSLRSTGNERRIKSAMRLPLSNRPMINLPEWIVQGHELVVKDGGFFTKAACKDVRMEGMTVDFFTTDSVKRKMRTLNGCTLDKFSVERVGKDDKAQTYLNFTCYTPCCLEIMQFFYEMQGSTVFSEFDTTQAAFTYKGESDEPETPANGFDFDPEAEAAAEKLDADPRTAPKRSHKKKVTN